MIVKIYYNKNLKMSVGKLASQVGHIMFKIGKIFKKEVPGMKIIVLEARHKKFNEIHQDLMEKDPLYLFEQHDLGFTEVEKGELTCFGYIE